MTAYARVNHCHNPVDVTFQVRVFSNMVSTVFYMFAYVFGHVKNAFKILITWAYKATVLVS